MFLPSPSRLCRIVCLCGVVLLGTAEAQEDLAADSSALERSPGAAGEASDGEDVGGDPFGDHLIEISGRSDRQMADSIAALARTQRWQHLDRLLRRLATQNLKPGQSAVMQRQIEPAVFLSMKLSDQLSDSSKAVLDQLAAGARQYAQSPERIRKAIAKLDDDSTDEQLSAARVLIKGGNVAIAELVAAAVANEPPADRRSILKALVRLGDDGSRALRQLALYGTPVARTRAIEALARINPEKYLVDLVTALHAVDATPTEKQIAAAALQRHFDTAAGRTTAINILLSDLGRLQQQAYRSENDDQLVTHWSPNPELDGVVFSRTRAIYAAYRMASDGSARLRRIGATGSPQVAVDALLADVGYRLLIDPDWGDAQQLASVAEMYGSSMTPEVLNAALQRALESEDSPAAIGLLRIMERTADVVGPDVFIGQPGSSLAPMVAAASNWDPRTRYEAARIAGGLVDGRSIAGGSEIKRTLSEMARLKDLPLAVIVETRQEVVAPLVQLLAALGFHGVTVQNVGQLQRLIDRDGDIGIIVSKQQLADLPPSEAVDVIRRTSRGRQLPIVFYGSDQRQAIQFGDEATRWNGPTYWIERPKTAAGLHEVLFELSTRRRMPPLTALDRRHFRQSAIELLGAVAEDPR